LIYKAKKRDKKFTSTFSKENSIYVIILAHQLA